MGFFRRSARYDKPIRNPFTDWIFAAWSAGTVERVRRERREFAHFRFWYHHSAPGAGLRAWSLVLGLVLVVLALGVSGLVSGAICTEGVGCVVVNRDGASLVPVGRVRSVLP